MALAAPPVNSTLVDPEDFAPPAQSLTWLTLAVKVLATELVSVRWAVGQIPVALADTLPAPVNPPWFPPACVRLS
ncbi:hypothetical protein [Streptomyces sp. CB01881]|uniref:hypothetical protein n=1 Tax=Streptomyces sp. CB01881 TaxID=2078691 RepID=UPI0011DF92FE|nr:hypothetical protein [Streptomyces sp. CB01881]